MTTSSASASDQRSASFDLLSPAVRQWIWQQGWLELRDIQERAIPVLSEGAADVIIVAPTAGGKTEAAFLPLISRIAGSGGAGFKLLYVSPLKALINDQFRRLDGLCEAVELPIHRWHGDVPAAAKTHARQNSDGIVLMTPESLEALLVRRGIEVPGLFTGLRAIVIDELHAFLGNPRGIQLQSLLHRLELAVGRRVVRIGLSATLADPTGAASFLRPGGSDRAIILQSQSDRQTVLLQLRACESTQLQEAESSDCSESARNGPLSVAIAGHLFRHLRGKHNLVFTRSRSDVELYADLLRRLSDKAGVPNEFYPHHANLSRGERELLERRLRDDAVPTTAICTSTLELGVDIGEVESVAQIGAPASVSALRQRLGRSGRRTSKPAIMRLYVTERAWSRDMHPVDMLRCELVQAIAMVQLLAEGWCETPRSPSVSLSTLVHQILALIAQLGGCSAHRAYATLCADGPFVEVGPALFARILRAIGAPEVGLIEQMADGTLLLGEVGERLVEHHDFYSVFETPHQFRIVYNGKELGALPVVTPLLPEMSIIFSGRRWRVVEVHHERATAIVVPSNAGIPPHFGGEGTGLDGAIVSRMRQVYEGNDVPAFIDSVARKLLIEARDTYQMLGLSRTQIIDTNADTLLFPWTSTTIANVLVLALRAKGLPASLKHIIISVHRARADQVRLCLELLASGDAPVVPGFTQRANQRYDRFLPRELLAAALAHERTEFEALTTVARRIVINE
jgi:ATP-dependent helicase Lhr and Lhr-like helicase